MKQIIILVLALTLFLTGCAKANPAPADDVLKVTDGNTQKTYTTEDLKSLGAAQASFNDITYLGVPLSTLVKDAGFDPTAISAVKATALDGFSANYEPALFNKEDTLVAYAQVNGPLGADDAPFRMVLPGEGGKLNPRQLVEIRVVP